MSAVWDQLAMDWAVSERLYEEENANAVLQRMRDLAEQLPPELRQQHLDFLDPTRTPRKKKHRRAESPTPPVKKPKSETSPPPKKKGTPKTAWTCKAVSGVATVCKGCRQATACLARWKGCGRCALCKASNKPYGAKNCPKVWPEHPDAEELVIEESESSESDE